MARRVLPPVLTGTSRLLPRAVSSFLKTPFSYFREDAFFDGAKELGRVAPFRCPDLTFLAKDNFAKESDGFCALCLKRLPPHPEAPSSVFYFLFTFFGDEARKNGMFGSVFPPPPLVNFFFFTQRIGWEPGLFFFFKTFLGAYKLVCPLQRGEQGLALCASAGA